MDTPRALAILQLEDSSLDADLERSWLRRSGIAFEAVRVETSAGFTQALDDRHWDLILADFRLPGFNGMAALEIARRKAPHLPFIFVSGMLGEEIAIETLKKGATDYVLKMRMERLGPAVNRAMAEVRERAERRRAEAALGETETRFRNMADSAPVMIWTAGPDAAWEYCNRLGLEFSGLRLTDPLGWSSLVHPDDLQRVRDAWHAAFRDRRGFTLECRLRRHDGEYRWLLCHAAPRIDAAGAFAGLVGSCTDVTEIKNTEERLRNSAKLESLGILAGGIAHDFNNLLTGIMGNASLAMEDLPPDSPIASSSSSS